MEREKQAPNQYRLAEDPGEVFLEIRRLRKRNAIFLGVLAAAVLGISVLAFQFWQQKQASASFEQYYRYVNYDQAAGQGGTGGGCCGPAGAGEGCGGAGIAGGLN